MTERRAALTNAIRISSVSVLWSGVVGAIAVASAMGSGSLSLLGFGVDAVIDAIASIVLIWRFAGESRTPDRAAQVERIAETVVGLALVVLSIYVAVASARSLLDGRSPTATALATGILVASVLLLPPIALTKRRIARSLKSGALRADSVLTAVAAGLAAISLAGLSVSSLGWWWADSAAALLVALIIAREGIGSVRMSRRS